jgi:hypothetical protein
MPTRRPCPSRAVADLDLLRCRAVDQSGPRLGPRAEAEAGSSRGPLTLHCRRHHRPSFQSGCSTSYGQRTASPPPTVHASISGRRPVHRATRENMTLCCLRHWQPTRRGSSTSPPSRWSCAQRGWCVLVAASSANELTHGGGAHGGPPCALDFGRGSRGRLVQRRIAILATPSGAARRAQTGDGAGQPRLHSDALPLRLPIRRSCARQARAPCIARCRESARMLDSACVSRHSIACLL